MVERAEEATNVLRYLLFLGPSISVKFHFLLEKGKRYEGYVLLLLS